MANRYKRAGKPRKTRKAAKGAWAKWLKVALVALVISAVAYSAAWAVGMAWQRTVELDMFAISSIRISGLRHVREKDFIAYMGNIKGDSILAVDLDSLVRRVEAHPWIKDASAKRELPDGIRLMLTERVPAALAVAGRARYLVDTEGVVLSAVQDEAWDVYPMIVCESPGRPGETGGSPGEGLAMALDLQGCVRSDLTEVLAGAVVHLGKDKLPYLTIDGTEVTVGTGGYQEKVRRLVEIINDVHQRAVSPKRIDLRFPGKVIVDGGRARQS